MSIRLQKNCIAKVWTYRLWGTKARTYRSSVIYIPPEFLQQGTFFFSLVGPTWKILEFNHLPSRDISVCPRRRFKRPQSSGLLKDIHSQKKSLCLLCLHLSLLWVCTTNISRRLLLLGPTKNKTQEDYMCRIIQYSTEIYPFKLTICGSFFFVGWTTSSSQNHTLQYVQQSPVCCCWGVQFLMLRFSLLPSLWTFWMCPVCG